MRCCNKKKSKQKEKLTNCVYLKDTILKLLVPITLYYNDIISDYLVLKGYYTENDYGYFCITCLAIFCSLSAQTIYSKQVTTYTISKTSKCLRILISMLYGTPLFILFYMIYYEWICKKRSKKHQIMTLYNQRTAIQLKFEILDESIIETVRINTFKSYFQSSILTLVQIYILGQYIMLNPSNITLKYPSNTTQFIILLWSTIMSFKSLSDCAWQRIAGFIDKTDGIKFYTKLLFRIRALIETFIRALRFMIYTVIFYNIIYSGVIGVVIICIEVLWKFIVCCYFGKGKNLTFNFKVYTVATWMIFSHERIKKHPFFMRFCDMFLWTFISILIPISLCYISDFKEEFKFDGVCNDLFVFKSNCIPIEVLILMGLLWIILGFCYLLTPSIFTMNYKSELITKTNDLQSSNLVTSININDHDAENNITIANNIQNNMNNMILMNNKNNMNYSVNSINNNIQNNMNSIHELHASYINNIMPQIQSNVSVNNQNNTSQSAEQVPVVNNLGPQMVFDRNFKRGQGRFLRDFTCTNAPMINKFSNS